MFELHRPWMNPREGRVNMRTSSSGSMKVSKRNSWLRFPQILRTELWNNFLFLFLSKQFDLPTISKETAFLSPDTWAKVFFFMKNTKWKWVQWIFQGEHCFCRRDFAILKRGGNLAPTREMWNNDMIIMANYLSFEFSRR